MYNYQIMCSVLSYKKIDVKKSEAANTLIQS